MVVKEVWIWVPCTCHLCGYYWIAVYPTTQIDDEVKLLGQIQCPQCGNWTDTGDEPEPYDEKP